MHALAVSEAVGDIMAMLGPARMISYLLPKVLPDLERWLFAGGMALEAILLLRLWQLKLALRYRALAFLLIVELGRSLVLSNLTYGQNANSIFYVVTAPLVWCAYAWVAFETYGMVLESYQGLSILGRRTLAGGLAISALIAVWVSTSHIRWEGERFPIILLTVAVTQAVTLTVLMFILLLCAFLLWYPIPLRRNLVFYVMGFSIYFLAFNYGMFLRSAGGSAMTDLASQVTMAMEALCLVFWIFSFRTQGETAAVAVGSLLRSGEEPRLLAQLDDLNAILLHAGKHKL
jgi:hypothetical protein